MSTQPPTEHRCAKCNRLLRNPSPDGLGPKCRRMIRRAGKAPEIVNGYKPHQVEKAVENLRQGGVALLRKSSKNRVYVVVGSDGTNAYRTARAACTCPAGLRAKHVCWHRIAAHIFDLAS
ncbi:hypothetical protein ACIOHS_27030 [Streptomyces sp. NPDC088253]|uniref:hypothetical protein n=1 Tax=Streptomyces sp. NPDC088253 TaxID=3365846 RepID=UPI00382197CF